MVHALAAIVFLGALGGSIAVIWYMIASRFDAILAALDPLVRPAYERAALDGLPQPAPLRSAGRRPAMVNPAPTRRQPTPLRAAAA